MASKIIYDYILGKLRIKDSVSAEEVSYDSSGNGLSANNVQDAIDELGNYEKLVTYYEVVTGASSGNSVTVPTNGTIQLDKFGSSKDAILSTVDGSGNVTYESPRDAGGNVITASLDVAGTYVFSGTPVDTNVAVIYVFKIKQIDWSNVDLSFILHETETTPVTLDKIVIVKQSNINETLGGDIDSTKEYFLDGVIDFSGFGSIIVPAGGIFIRGYNFDISGIVCSDDNFTLFESAVGGSGDVLFGDFFIDVSGANSKVYNLTDVSGFNAIECNTVNYNNCSSLGDLYNYRQGLETGTGRFGGSPSLTLHGTWLGGFRITTSITRSMSDTTTAPLFCAGTAFVMQSRFLTDMNVDLGDLQPLLDFSSANFPNPSTLELRDVILTRAGLITPNDANITPNIAASNLSCSWKGNNGVNNTFVGAIATITTEVTTIISAIDTPSVLLGTVTTSDLQHFDSPSNGQLRHLGTNPREYTVNFDFVLEGNANRDYKIELVKDNGGATTLIYQQTRVVNNLQGGRDVTYYTGLANVILNKDEFVYWQVTNLSNNSNCTLELDSSWSVEER